MTSALRVSDVCVSYGQFEAAHSISLDLEQGTTATIIGANGAGKSTLLNAIAGILPMRGSISLFNVDIAQEGTAPGVRNRSGMIDFIRRSAITYWHQSCTAKMGRDGMSVVDNELNVYGIDGLRIADSSIMPRIPTGNTMARCVVIGERAADLIRKIHGLTAVGERFARSI